MPFFCLKPIKHYLTTKKIGLTCIIICIYICCMSTVKENIAQLYKDIKAEFLKLTSIKEFGVPKYSEKWIFAKISAKFYKSPKTIENIVFNRC